MLDLDLSDLSLVDLVQQEESEVLVLVEPEAVLLELVQD